MNLDFSIKKKKKPIASIPFFKQTKVLSTQPFITSRQFPSKAREAKEIQEADPCCVT